MTNNSNNKSEFVAGNIKNYINEWRKITDDCHVLETVEGCTIDLIHKPYQSYTPKPLKVNDLEMGIIDNEIDIMIKKGVIKPSVHEKDEFISSIFLRPKKDPGKFRVILNLKPFNKFVKSEHFKMDTIMTCIGLMNKDCFMASIDLRDAYYSIPIARSDQKYLKFIWKDTLYEYTCLPMGLACAPRKFVKLLKPVFAFLHTRGLISSGYLDDTYIQGNTFISCQQNVTETINILTNLGFFIHWEKSVTTPCKVLEHLGFILNSENMTVSLTEQKYDKLVEKIENTLKEKQPTIRTVASAIGSMVSYAPGVQLGPLFHKQLEIEKSMALRNKQGDYDALMTLSPLAKDHLTWWKHNALTNPVIITKEQPKFVLCTDASTSGWGAKLGKRKCGGRWSEKEKDKHINELELVAILFGLQALCDKMRNTHILIKCDNTTAVAYVRNMGGCKSLRCNQVARQIWYWAIKYNIWLSITHIEGRLNIEPDRLSRVFDDRTEWMLNPILFKQIYDIYKPTRDLFASRLNKQLDCYMSWQPDPHAVAVDAFSTDWANHLNYIFPPFSMLTRVLGKLEADQAEAILIAPYWTTQSWFPKMLQLLVEVPKILPRGKKQLVLPFDTNVTHPLWRKMHLCVCRLSGVSSKTRAFRKMLRESYYNPGDQPQENSTTHTYKNGKYFAIEGKWILINPL